MLIEFEYKVCISTNVNIIKKYYMSKINMIYKKYSYVILYSLYMTMIRISSFEKFKISAIIIGRENEIQYLVYMAR